MTEADGVVHVTLGRTTVALPIVPRFTVPGSELPTGGLVAPMATHFVWNLAIFVLWPIH